MSLHGAAIIYAVLTGAPGVTALVPAARISPDRAEQAGAVPCIVFSLVSTAERAPLLEGSPFDLPAERWQVDIYSRTRRTVGAAGGTWDIAEAVRAAFAAPGLWPLTVPGTGVLGHLAQPVGARDFTEQDTRLLRTSLDYRVQLTRV